MTILVTGASGFLGGAVARALLERGETVRAFARRDMADLASRGAEVQQGDLSDDAAVDRAVRGVSAVMHVGAKAGVWGAPADFHASNVVGTKNVLASCRAHGVRKLVFTSTPSVVHSGRDVVNADESAPYASHFETPYQATKAEAERQVLAANSAELATVALRPHLIWGPGDEQLLPRLVERARAGRLMFPGDGKALVDSTFIDSAVEAHLLALDRLAPGAACAGRAYFVSQGEPMEIEALVNALFRAVGVKPVHRHVSVPVALAVGGALEFLFRAVNAKAEPPTTRFVVRQMSTAHYFNLTAIRADLGFGPRVSLAQGLENLRVWHASQPAS